MFNRAHDNHELRRFGHLFTEPNDVIDFRKRSSIILAKAKQTESRRTREVCSLTIVVDFCSIFYTFCRYSRPLFSFDFGCPSWNLSNFTSVYIYCCISIISDTLSFRFHWNFVIILMCASIILGRTKICTWFRQNFNHPSIIL